MDEHPKFITAKVCIALLAFLFTLCKNDNEGEYMQIYNCIELKVLYKDETMFTTNDTAVITKVIESVAYANPDTSADDFKSFWYVKVLCASNANYRIEILGSRYRFKGKRYVADHNIGNRLNEILGTSIDFNGGKQ